MRSDSSLAAIPGVVWLLTLCVALVGANALTLGPIAPAIAIDYAIAASQVLYASAAYGAGTAIGALFLARYIDNTGARSMLRLALSGLFSAFVGSALASSATLLTLAQLLAGLSAGVALPACYSVAAAVATRGDESRILGIVLTGWTLSLVAGVTLSALLADWLHWRSVFVLLAVLTLAVLLASRRARLPGGASGLPAPSPLSAWRVPGVPVLLLRVAGYMMAFYGVYAYLGDHVVHQLQLSVSHNGWLSASYGLGFGLAALLNRYLDQWPRQRAITLSLLALALLYLGLATIAASYSLLLPAVLLWGVINHLAVNVLIAALGAADPAQRGTLLGLYSGTTYLSMSVATVGFGWLYQYSEFSTLCVTAALLCAVAAISRQQRQP